MVFSNPEPHNGNIMPATEVRELLGTAEHLLWVMARCDVESLSGQRGTVLRQLRELEAKAQSLHIPDLYREIVTHCGPR